MNLAKQARGSCPGVWTPMESGDGLIVRLRPRHSRLKGEELRTVCRLARETGNGVIEVTRRANLQVRGVSSVAWPRLRDALVQLGLAEADREAEQLPALLVCPLSGLDSRCPPLERVAGELRAMLEGSQAARALSHKFSIVVSGGSRSSGDVSADVHVRLDPEGEGLADIVVAGTAHGGVALGRCRESDAHAVLRRCFDALAQKGHRRMRDVALGPERGLLIAAAGHLLAPPRAVAAEAWSRPLLGFQIGWAGFAVPFGSAPASAWSVVADVAEQLGDGEVRLTPSRAVLLPGVSEVDAPSVFARLASAGFTADERWSDVELTACSGAPACSSARGETRRLAGDVGELLRPLQRRLSVHVSGCAKGCARDGSADVTIVRGESGAHLGFGVDVSGAAAAQALPMAALTARIASHFTASEAVRRSLRGTESRA